MRFLSAASFWLPDRYLRTGWEAHIPFAFWLVDALRPRSFVELGTYSGLSYFAFCQAVAWTGSETDAVAVDTWKGDEYLGDYGEHVFEDVREYNERYPFSQLLRADFAAAAPCFRDGSIELLHVDGRHNYEDVAADYANYLPKLAPNAVVLFHDTRLGGSSGVWRLFDGLPLPKFEFFHCNGLGMVALGEVHERLAPWFEAPRGQLDWIRNTYAYLGHSMELRARYDVDARVEETQNIVNTAEEVLCL